MIKVTTKIKIHKNYILCVVIRLLGNLIFYMSISHDIYIINFKNQDRSLLSINVSIIKTHKRKNSNKTL